MLQSDHNDEALAQGLCALIKNGEGEEERRVECGAWATHKAVVIYSALQHLG